MTFKAKRIYKADIPIPINCLEYNFQRNKGYIYEDKYSADYKKIISEVDKSIESGKLKEFKLKSVKEQKNINSKTSKTFMDLICAPNSEQAYTNILYSILEQEEVLKHFCEKFKGRNTFDSKGTFKVFRETSIVNGRMDICAESDNQRVIIENKVNSGLNGIKPADNKSQLSTYYEKWGKDEGRKEPLCFIVVPNFKTSEIEKEIEIYDKEMLDIYHIITYGDIADFIKSEFDAGNIQETYIYFSLKNQIINAFKNLSYSTKEELYAQMFFDATTK